jgi:hypothetical protein
MTYALGEKWADLFDKVIVDAQKPLFFSSKSSFCSDDLKKLDTLGD